LQIQVPVKTQLMHKRSPSRHALPPRLIWLQGSLQFAGGGTQV
jgi:hypothetical protein